jgi:hypothetical protein
MKSILLTNGDVALIDDQDYDRVAEFKWFKWSPYKGIWYACRTEKGRERKLILMHRFIINVLDPSRMIDHRDGNGLNNTRSNLRECSHLENMRNRKMHSNNKSGYRGVWRFKRWFRAGIQLNGKRISLGYFDDAIEAAKAYDAKATELFGEFASLNFPKSVSG